MTTRKTLCCRCTRKLTSEAVPIGTQWFCKTCLYVCPLCQVPRPASNHPCATAGCTLLCSMGCGRVLNKIHKDQTKARCNFQECNKWACPLCKEEPVVSRDWWNMPTKISKLPPCGCWICAKCRDRKKDCSAVHKTVKISKHRDYKQQLESVCDDFVMDRWSFDFQEFRVTLQRFALFFKTWTSAWDLVGKFDSRAFRGNNLLRMQSVLQLTFEPQPEMFLSRNGFHEVCRTWYLSAGHVAKARRDEFLKTFQDRIPTVQPRVSLNLDKPHEMPAWWPVRYIREDEVSDLNTLSDLGFRHILGLGMDSELMKLAIPAIMRLEDTDCPVRVAVSPIHVCWKSGTPPRNSPMERFFLWLKQNARVFVTDWDTNNKRRVRLLSDQLSSDVDVPGLILLEGVWTFVRNTWTRSYNAVRLFAAFHARCGSKSPLFALNRSSLFDFRVLRVTMKLSGLYQRGRKRPLEPPVE